VHVPTHALASWLVADLGGLRARRDRILVLASGLVMDLDAAAGLFGQEAYERWHRTLLHNALAAALVALLCGLAARQRLRTAALALLCFHLHLLGDLAGAAGPDGSLWAVPYLQPFSALELSVSWQWGLASWQNVLLTVALLAAQGQLGRLRGRTIVEALSLRADAAVVEVLRRRFPLRAR
jgi:hypothetical protein